MRVTIEALGAWMLKCNPAVTDLGRLLSSGEAISTWCVADNYRSALMDTGQPAVLWVSGPRKSAFPRGVWGVGRVRAPALPQPGSTKAGRSGHRTLVSQLEIRLLATPITIEEIESVVALREIEVIRQPFMSNPSWLSTAEFAALDALR